MTSLDYVTKYRDLTAQKAAINSEIKNLENDSNSMLTIQKICCESEEAINTKLAVYEAFEADEITEFEKYSLLASVEEKCLDVVVTEGALQNRNLSVGTMLKIAAAVTSVNLILAAIAKIRSNNKLIKENIAANQDLSRIERELKNIQSRLYQQRSFITSKLNEVNRDIEDANYDIDKHGNPVKKTVTDNGETLDVNSDYNPKKANAARDKLDASEKIHDELVDSRLAVDRELVNIKGLKFELRRIAKKFGSEDEIADLDKRIESAKQRVDELIK